MVGDESNRYTSLAVARIDNWNGFAIQSICEFLDGPRLAICCLIEKTLGSITQSLRIVCEHCPLKCCEESALFFVAFRIAALPWFPSHCDQRLRH